MTYNIMHNVMNLKFKKNEGLKNEIFINYLINTTKFINKEARRRFNYNYDIMSYSFNSRRNMAEISIGSTKKYIDYYIRDIFEIVGSFSGEKLENLFKVIESKVLKIQSNMKKIEKYINEFQDDFFTDKNMFKIELIRDYSKLLIHISYKEIKVIDRINIDIDIDEKIIFNKLNELKYEYIRQSHNNALSKDQFEQIVDFVCKRQDTFLIKKIYTNEFLDKQSKDKLKSVLIANELSRQEANFDDGWTML